MIRTIKIFTYKNAYAFFIKLLATSKQLIRRNSICCLKNQAISFGDRLDPSPPHVCFQSFFKDPLPLPSTTNSLLERACWKRWKELIIMLVHIYIEI